MIELNQKQRNAVDFMHDFTKSAQRMMVLEGFAGTGKTTCVQTFAKESGKRIAFTAPTNKATKVLRNMASEEVDVACCTIYSLLGLILDGSGEIREVKAEGENRADQFDVIVVDEGSMVGDNLFNHIGQAASTYGVQIIFMGDPAQLPPVNETHSPVFDLGQKITLTEVMRHDNQILALATNIRQAIYGEAELNLVADNDESGGVFIANGSRFRNQLERGFTSETYKDHSDSFKTIAWRNVTVNAHNDFIRSCMYGDPLPEPFELGERIVACAPVLDLVSRLSSGPTELVLHTDEEATVEQIEVTEHPIYKNIMCDVVKVQDDYGSVWGTCYTVNRESKGAHKALMDDLANAAKKDRSRWGAFWDAKDSFHDLRPCHAITAHRSQGSTYETVFVNVADILLNRNRTEALKCLYVAVSRASRIVVLKLK